VKELHAKGEAAFATEAGDKARAWWNHSRNSEDAKMKPAWFEAAKKLKTALFCSFKAPCERDLTERQNTYYNTENREHAHVVACHLRP
jgi:hypothetical protein